MQGEIGTAIQYRKEIFYDIEKYVKGKKKIDTVIIGMIIIKILPPMK